MRLNTQFHNDRAKHLARLLAEVHIVSCGNVKINNYIFYIYNTEQ